MGQHYVKFELVGDPAIDPLQPEALVYEPQAGWHAQLVALEYSGAGGTGHRPGPDRVRARRCSAWAQATGMASSRTASTSAITGCTNRTRSGAFNDWNPNVSCLGTGDNGG